jgi:hypothetical protein
VAAASQAGLRVPPGSPGRFTPHRLRHTYATSPPSKVEWLQSEFLKTRVAHGYCSRHLAAEACRYANICEQCDNVAPAAETPRFVPASSPTSVFCTPTRQAAAGTAKSLATPESSTSSKATSRLSSLPEPTATPTL